MADQYYYRVYGETVRSDFEMKELVPCEPVETPDIEVVLERIPEHYIETIENGNSWLIVENREIAFKIDNVGYYYIYENGHKMSIDCIEDCDVYNRKVFTLGSGMGGCLILQGRIPIHGGTVVQNGKAVIVTGDSGAGKSTISTALRLDGMGFLADDVSVLDRDEQGKLVVHPAYPQQKLCRDAALNFGYKLEDLLYINESRDKFAIRLDDSFESEAKPLAAFVELTLAPEDQQEDIVIQEVVGHQKLFCLNHNIYRFFLYSMIGMQPEIMQKCLHIIGETPIYRISRKKDADTVGTIVRMIRGLQELQ